MNTERDRPSPDANRQDASNKWLPQVDHENGAHSLETGRIYHDMLLDILCIAINYSFSHTKSMPDNER